VEGGGDPQAVARLLGLRGVPHYVRGDEETVASESVF
jgi:hypothetical protein